MAMAATVVVGLVGAASAMEPQDTGGPLSPDQQCPTEPHTRLHSNLD